MTVIGQRFGNYRALSLLGEGGMGAVYLAEHPDIGRRVAIKVLRPDLIKDAQVLSRFLNEARAANAIRHPNIIEILDSGTLPPGTPHEGTPFLVMELLEGEVLSGRIARVRKLPLADVLDFSCQVASALAAAHEKGIIHRDLKPDNLFIIPDPSDPARERVKVLDFGIAKLQTFPTGGGMQTRTGTLMGTPVYMSPEQCLGTRAIDARSDIYALGIIMYEMLTGRPPFLSEGFGELVNMHLNARPRPLRDLEPTIPDAVASLVERALEKAPEARQRSAAELHFELRAAGAPYLLPSRELPAGGVPATTLPGPMARVPTAVAHPFGGSTTLSTGTGERVATTVPLAVRRPTRTLLVGALLMAGLAVAVVAGLRRGSTSLGPLSRPAPLAEAQAAQRGTVRLTIESRPPGAAVTDVASGRVLGATPLVLERRSPQPPLTVRLEKPGFAAVTRALALEGVYTEVVPLVAAPAPAGAPAQAITSAPEQSPPNRTANKKAPPSRPHHATPPAASSEEEPAKL